VIEQYLLVDRADQPRAGSGGTSRDNGHLMLLALRSLNTGVTWGPCADGDC
jgi:hypothetical protein